MSLVRSRAEVMGQWRRRLRCGIDGGARGVGLIDVAVALLGILYLEGVWQARLG